MVFLIWTGLVEGGMLVVELGCNGFIIWTGLVEAGMPEVELDCDGSPYELGRDGFSYLDRSGGGRHAGG